MSEKNDGSDDHSSRASSIEDEDSNNEYPPNVVRLEPDIGLGSGTQQNNRKRRSSGGNPRREENSISFRHFLQGEICHSSNASYPDLYTCSRQDRPVIDGSVVDPDSPDLPDFVQDHLAVEHMYFNDAGHASSINMQNLPDFASCMPRVENDVHLRHRPENAVQNHDSRRVPRNRVPLDLPVPNFLLDNGPPQMNANSTLPVDLTSRAHAAPITCNARSPVDMELPAASAGGRLPDFLSDGHVLAPGNPRHRDARAGTTSENGSEAEARDERHNLISVLRHENSRLREELSVLQSVLLKKDDRIKELEDLVMALEISKLQMSADANTQTLNKSTGGEDVRRSRREQRLPQNEVCSSQKRDNAQPAETCIKKNLASEVLQQALDSNFTNKVREMTSTSERLVRELLKIIVEMQQDIGSNDAPSPSSKLETNQDPDDSAGGSAASII